MRHAFVICAYKESSYLEDCVCSLKNQSVKSDILMVTSTPNAHIQKVCDAYKIPLIVNTGEGGLAQDWNFGYRQSDAELVTLAHQDDLYEKDYAKSVIEAYHPEEKAQILFTDYFEYRNGQRVHDNRNLKIKRLLLTPMKVRCLSNSVFVRRRVLSLGNPICCPAVTFVKKNLPEVVFTPGMKSNSDWLAWEMLSKRPGRFVYIPQPLMCHRIHEESTTSEIIGDNKRRQEDLEVLKLFWPKPVAKFIGKYYAASEKSNTI